jgi:hypothetical protein
VVGRSADWAFLVARAKPPGCGQAKENMFVGTPGQNSGGFFRREIGVGCDKIFDRDICGCRPNCYQRHFGTLK